DRVGFIDRLDCQQQVRRLRIEPGRKPVAVSPRPDGCLDQGRPTRSRADRLKPPGHLVPVAIRESQVRQWVERPSCPSLARKYSPPRARVYLQAIALAASGQGLPRFLVHDSLTPSSSSRTPSTHTTIGSPVWSGHAPTILRTTP